MSDFKLSSYQQDILDFFINHPQDNIYINALAGSGKSSTICMLTEHTTTSDVYVAFNKSIAEEFKTKIKNTKTKVYTLHGLAFMIMNNNLEEKATIGFGVNNKAVVDNLKMYKIIGDKVFDYYKFKKFEYKCFIKDNFVQLYNLCRLTYINMDKKEDILNLVDEYNLFIDNGTCKGEAMPNNNLICDWIKFMNIQDIGQFENNNTVDFTDMLYITLNKLKSGEWKVPYYLMFTNVMADEDQDLSIVQLSLLKFIKRSNGRFVTVGDKNQAIYGFAGASCKSSELVKKFFAPMTEFDLPINYRCPTSHLDLVRERFDIPIQARPDAPEGKIFSINKPEICKYVQGGDFIISRKNKWLSSVIIDLVKHSIPIYMEDKDVVKKILATINKSKSLNVDDFYSQLIDKRKSFDKAIVKIKKNDNIPDEEKESVISDNSNYIDDINFIIEIIKSYKGEKSISSFSSYVKKLLNTKFDDNCVRLTSIHKSKGLEAKNVFVLNEAKVCFDPRNSYDLNQQERNLAYISITRAENNLYLVREPEKDG